jgi:2-polyprenyl-6-methoxyphenol hydroxylase-like FAD-dependent oxidoreductase
MTCRDFERGWNEVLDAGGPGASPSDLERTLRDHAANCPACRQVAARYQLLQRALRAWSVNATAPVDLADRILAAAQSPSSGRWGASLRGGRPLWRIGLPLATAAAAALALVFVRPAIDVPRAERRTTIAGNAARGPVPIDAKTLDTALADATAATWELARSTSEPAARISRQVLDAATARDSISVADTSDSFSVSSYVPAAPDSAAASAMLQQVGDSLSSSVGPLSTTARHAFGFLLAPAPAKPEARQVPPAAKGA